MAKMLTINSCVKQRARGMISGDARERHSMSAMIMYGLRCASHVLAKAFINFRIECGLLPAVVRDP